MFINSNFSARISSPRQDCELNLGQIYIAGNSQADPVDSMHHTELDSQLDQSLHR